LATALENSEGSVNTKKEQSVIAVRRDWQGTVMAIMAITELGVLI
jgi:hypothetical protein